MAMARRNEPNPGKERELRPSGAALPRGQWVTGLAFVLALALVIARGTMDEVLRDPFEPRPGMEASPRAPGPATSLGLDLLCAAPALLVLARRVIDPTFALRASWAHLLLLGAGAWAACSVAWAGDKFAALVASSNLVASALLLWAMSQLVRSWLRLRMVAGAAAAVLLVYVATGLHYRLVDFPDTLRQWEQDRPRYLRERGWEDGSFHARAFENRIKSGDITVFSRSPNQYAAVVVMLGVVVAGLVLQRRADGDRPAPLLVPAALLGVAAAYVIVHTHARLALLTPLLAAAALAILSRAAVRAWLARRSRTAYFAGATLFLLGVAAVVGHGLHHGGLPDKSLTFRWYYWTGAARLLAEHPARGVGWATFGEHYTRVRPPQAPEEVKDPHNFLVRAFAELGLIGGLLVAAWIARSWWELTRPTVPPPLPPASADCAGRRAIWGLSLLAVLAVLFNLLLAIDFGQADIGLFGEMGGAVSGDGRMRPGNAFVIMQVFQRVAVLGLVAVGLGFGTIRSFKHERLDDRPAPWLLYGILVALGVFLLHNLIDFSLLEAGPLALFAALMGSAIGVRQSTAEPRPRNRTPLAAALALACAAWVAAAALAWLPTMRAASLAEEADTLVRRSGAGSPVPLLTDAAQKYQEAAAVEPFDGEPLKRAASALAALNRARGDTAPARELINAAIARNPFAISYRTMLAHLESETRPPDRARVNAAFSAALALNPAEVPLRLDYAGVLEQVFKDPPAALTQYREALSYDDKLPPDEPKRLDPKRRAEVEQKIAALSP